MKQMDVDIENLAEELNDLKTSIDSLRSSMIDLIDLCKDLKDVDLSMTNEALEEGIARMTKENQIMEERINALQG